MIENETIKINKSELLYRRQFIMGPKYLNKFNHWKKIKISEELYLNVHPDLEINYVSNDHTSLVLLGFILDPYNPEYSNNDILNKLIEENNTFEDVILGTYKLGGRWIIIYKNNQATRTKQATHKRIKRDH